MDPVQPTLTTPRLLLRPFALEDGPRVRELAGERAIAEMTLTIPHPYPEGAAEAWIATHAPAFAAGTQASFAITQRSDGALVGGVGLTINAEHARAELGYWIGIPYWNRGYATEAARAVMDFGFDRLGLHRIFAVHRATNPASGRVLQKIGMQFEGIRRHGMRKWGVFDDLAQYAALSTDPRPPAPPAS